MLKERSIHRAFERQAQLRPRQVAVRQGDVMLTYQAVNERANFVARYLRENGVRRGDVVALSMARSPEMIIAMLGILKSGGAYLPLDQANPVSRSRACLDEAGVRVIIMDRECGELINGNRLCLKTADDALFGSKLEDFDDRGPQGEDRAYVMYTSGSTGKPKGVVVPHRAVVRLVNEANYIEIHPTDSILQFSPISFDASTFEIWGALLNGATLVLYSGAVLDPNLLKKDIRDHDVTIMWLTAALFHLIANNYIDAIRTVRVLLAGGDVLYPKVVNKVLDEIKDITVINGYGPTENTTFTCCHRMTVANRPAERVPIGKPISGTNVLILDSNRHPVLPGEVGELYACGEGVALGYLGEEIGGGSFFYDQALSDGLVYRTGDLVRENSCGEIEFLGRKDNQVKIRGYRVSLEEISSSLLEFKDITDTVVFLHKRESGDQILVAYLQLREGSDASGTEIRRHLATDLPPYMIPDKFVMGADLPVTPNGKLDRKSIEASVSRL